MAIEEVINTFKYHVFAPMGRFQLELIIYHYRIVLNNKKLVFIVFQLRGLKCFKNNNRQGKWKTAMFVNERN